MFSLLLIQHNSNKLIAKLFKKKEIISFIQIKMGQSESILTLDTRKILGLEDFEKNFNTDDLKVKNKIGNKGA